VEEELTVKNIIIGKQFEDNYNLQKLLQIANEKKINIHVVQAGSKIDIEKDVSFDILWPSADMAISSNVVNNNALVCKLKFKGFSMLFTGDIEEEAELAMCKLYEGTNALNATVLKVAHHGSKSSSTEDFLNMVLPKFAVIGVGKNNLYGHPASSVISRLTQMRNTGA
jgi:competence protein ComEC